MLLLGSSNWQLNHGICFAHTALPFARVQPQQSHLGQSPVTTEAHAVHVALTHSPIADYFYFP